MGRPRVEHPDRVATAVRLTPDLTERLSAEADRRDLSRNRLIERLLGWALPAWEEEDV